MKLIVAISMNNAAFDPHGCEACRILGDLGNRMYGRAVEVGQSYTLADLNGNKVGQARVEED